MADFTISTIAKFIDEMSSPMRGLSRNMSKFSKQAKQMGQTMTAKVTVPFIAAAGVVGKTSYDFQDSMNGLKSVMLLTSKDITGDMEKLEAKSLELGNATQYSASESASAMEFLGRAGWSTNEILANTGNVLNLAAASGLDLARSADIASNIMGAFGISAENVEATAKVFDTLAAVTGTSNVNMEQLADTMKMSAPIASTFGASLEDTAAMTGLLGNIGIQGTVAGTAMKRAFTAFTGGSKDLKALGVQTMDAQGNMLPMVDILKQLSGGLKGLGSGKQLQIIEGIFGKIGMAGATELIKQVESGKLQEFSDQLNNMDGAALEMAKARMEGLPGALKYMASAAETAMISFGEGSELSEGLISLAGCIKNLSNWLTNLSGPMKKTILVVGGLVAIIGPILLIVGALIPMIAAISTPIWGWVAGVAALVGVFTYLYNRFELFRLIMADLWSLFKGFIKVIYEISKAIFLWLTPLGWAVQLVKLLWSGIDSLVQSFGGWGKVLDGVTNAYKSVRGFFGANKGDKSNQAITPNNKNTVAGEISVKFENAPKGTRVDSNASSGLSLGTETGYQVAGAMG